MTPVPPTDAESEAALTAFADDRAFALAQLTRLVMIRRAVAAGFYTDALEEAATS
ncbi:MAG TPA: hypothetical protein VGJ60_07155 [Chloroflexota bacterium]|jgi:hypothetical protein